MKLLNLSSDNVKFKTLNFKPGLNIIAGLQLSENEKKSINGIGKSLSLLLIQLILGGSLDNKKIKDKKLKNFLENYGNFYLSLEHKEKQYEIKKDFSKPEYYINNEKIQNKDYSSRLNEIFNLDGDLAFRGVFNCFARRYGGDYYADPLRQQGRALNDYQQRLINFKLLKIDTTLVKQQFELKEQIDRLDKAKKAINEYEKALDKTNLKDLEDEYNKLIDDKKNFKIAPNYDKLSKKAEELTKEVNNLRNEIEKLKKILLKKVDNINTSENINVNIGEIEKLYCEAKFFFDDKIVKRLDDAQKFHNTLIINRKNRLELEIRELKLEMSEKENKLQSLEEKRDNHLKDLEGKGALEEYTTIEKRIRYLYDEINKLTKYEKTLGEFKKEKSKLSIESTRVKEESILYLEREKFDLEELENKFRTIVKRFYDNHGGSLKIKETKNAKYLYDINIEIPKGASQAVGEVEIFCYDILLYEKNKELLNFLAHDGTIFSEMDPRQKAMIFKIVLELIEKYDLQYFVNIGENSLKEVLEQGILTDDEKHQIKDSIILKLYDKEPKNWLMGEEFN